MPKILFRPAPTPPPFVPPTPTVLEDESILFTTWPFQANESVRGIFRCDALPKQNPIYILFEYNSSTANQNFQTNCTFNEDGTISFEIVPNDSSDVLHSVSVDLNSSPDSPDFAPLNVLNN